jgi:pyruvate kinase
MPTCGPGAVGTVGRVTRRTKIIATIGPASDSPAILQGLVEAGMDVARLGLAHDSMDTQVARIENIRKAAREVGRPVGVLADLPGPKVRAGAFGDDGVTVNEGDRLRMVPGSKASTAEVVEVDYEGLLSDVHPGDHLLFGDGVVVVEVADKDNDSLHIEVIHGGHLQGRPGVHIPSDRLRTSTPTPDDLRALDDLLEVGIDMVAVSFVRSAHDVRRVGVEPHPRGPLVVAKIETRAAVENLEGIIEASGAIMVARGDLGAELPIEDLPHLQKEIIQHCIRLGRPAITATQMLESMVHAPIPTRAEASDVANAVFDGSSALMLSGESAIGHDPVRAVRMMATIAERADDRFDHEGWMEDLRRAAISEPEAADRKVTDTMTMAAARTSEELGASAIICVSRSGFTVRTIARFRPRAQILGFSPDERTVRQLTMSWGATPILLDRITSNESVVRDAVEIARNQGLVRSGETVVVLAGTDENSRATDVLRVVRVP